MLHTPRLVFITGIGRGLGRATAKLAAMRGFDVVGTVRKESDRAVAEQINSEVLREGGVGHVRCELFDARSPGELPESTLQALRQADILINNSGVGGDIFSPDINLSNINGEILDDTLMVNAKAPLQLMNLAMPGMKARGWGRVVNVSSVLARLSDYIGDTPTPAYRLSKLMLNGITVLAAQEYRGTGVLVNSLCPGWCKTQMGREMAPDTPEQGAERIMRLAQLPDDGPTGAYFVDNQISSF